MSDLAAIREHHHPYPGTDVCQHDRFGWPCDTAQVLAALAAGRFVATYWRDAYMGMDNIARTGAHGLAMTLAALDGETDPRQLGLERSDDEAFRAALADAGSAGDE